MKIQTLLISFILLIFSCSFFEKEKKDNTATIALVAAGSSVAASNSWDTSKFGTDTNFISSMKSEQTLSTLISSYSVPYDFNQNDVVGPTDWTIKYGVKPQAVVYSNSDGSLDLAWQNITDETNPKIIISNIARVDANTYKISSNYIISSLGYLGGFTKDDSGNYYVMTARKEDLAGVISPKSNAPWARKGVVAIVKIDSSKQSISYTTNLIGDPATNDSYEFRHIFSPMNAGTSRVAYGDGIVLSFFAKNLGYDTSISQRHQNGLFTTIDSTAGTEITGINAYSHSFEQRVFYDSENKRFIGLELGDAYSRAIGLSIYSVANSKGTKKTFMAFLIKGTSGENNTYTRLGGVVNTSSGYLILFATEKDATVATAQATYPTNLALVRMTKTLSVTESSSTNANYDSSFVGEDFTVTQSGNSVTNKGVKWLTSYTGISTGTVERPKIVSLSDGSIIVLWEEWTVSSNKSSYISTKAMLVDSNGNITKSATALGNYHLSRGDDVVPICAPDKTCLEAGWITGDSVNKKIILYKVDKTLTLKLVTIQ